MMRRKERGPGLANDPGFYWQAQLVPLAALTSETHKHHELRVTTLGDCDLRQGQL